MTIAGIALAILAPLIAVLIQFAISRKREFLADASGALLTRYPEGLASALEKINSYDKPMKKANNATAHLLSQIHLARAVQKRHKQDFYDSPANRRKIESIAPEIIIETTGGFA